MQRCVWFMGVASVALLVAFTAPARADKKPVKTTKEFSGSVDDEALHKDAPAVIASAKALESLWKSWKIADKQPEVDFAKQLVVITTSRGSKVSLRAILDDTKGDLQVLGLGTRDLRPGFRYVIGLVSRDGVKTVNGKNLP